MSVLLPEVGLLTWAIVALVGAMLCLFVVILVPGSGVSRDRRYYGIEREVSLLTRATTTATGTIEAVLHRGGGDTRKAANALDRAGIRMAVAEYVLMSLAALLVAVAAGYLLAGLGAGVLLGALTGAGAWGFVTVKADRRRAKFSEQLDDMLQLLASSLRAGHSLLQSMDSVARELEEPAGSEIARVVNQVRVGRDLGASMDEAADRMDSDDFRWIAQAVAIHRQVGGNLAEVLDTVSETIRERGQIRRQVKALAAEGKLSAYILLGLPFVVALTLLFLNPGYLDRLFDNPLGLTMVAVGAVMLTIGAFWMRKMITIKF